MKRDFIAAMWVLILFIAIVGLVCAIEAIAEKRGRREGSLRFIWHTNYVTITNLVTTYKQNHQ